VKTRLIWTETAFARLLEIEDYVADDDPAAAIRLVARLIARGEALTRFPNLGRKAPELPKSDLREQVEGNYRIVYRERPGLVEILTVFEGHRRFPLGDLPDDE
jgi:plasmid stabilization system protein ParE